MISFSVNLEPVPKGRPRYVVRGTFAVVYTPKETKQAQELFISKAKAFCPKEPLTGALKVTLNFFKVKPKSYSKKIINWTKKPDLDNFAKLYLDAMNKIFYEDDSQIVTLILNKSYSDVAKIEVFIESLI